MTMISISPMPFRSMPRRAVLCRRAASAAAAAASPSFRRKRRVPAAAAARRWLSSSSSSSSSPPNHDHDDADVQPGSVEGVFLFHRHGDRAPARRMVSDAYADDEAEFWRSRIHKSSSGPSSGRDVLDEYLGRRFPPSIHLSNNGGQFLDTKREPYGFLTFKGMEQMRTAGRRCAERYDQYGHHASLSERDDSDGSNSSAAAIGKRLLEHWNITAYSTCYLRTVRSVQCFLHGLLGNDDGYELPYEEYDMRSDEVPSDDGTQIQPEDQQVSIHVRDRSSDTLNAFDRNPDLMKDLVTEVVDTPHFQRHDATASALAARLSQHLPGLLVPGQKLFGGPSGINWIHAADHFVCRSCHDLTYSHFSAGQDDRRVEEALTAMHLPTLLHLAWRFRQWYKSPPLLAAIAAPPLREVEDQIRSAVDMDVGDRRPFVVYSCHDVTILSLLYGLGVDFLEDDKGSGWQFWPHYATTLVIELIRVRAGRGDPDDTHTLRILLNGTPLRVVSLRRKTDRDGDRLLRVSDFAAIVDDLEVAGGWGPNGRLADDPACASVRRDMSGWTG